MVGQPYVTDHIDFIFMCPEILLNKIKLSIYFILNFYALKLLSCLFITVMF